MSLNEPAVEEAALEWYRESRYAFGHVPQLASVELAALALAASEGTFDHVRIHAANSEHPVVLSKSLQHLAQAGFLESTGGRCAVVHLPGDAIHSPDDVFGPAPRISAPNSPNMGASSPNLASSFPNLDEQRDPDGCLISEQLALPVVDDLESLSIPSALGWKGWPRSPEPRARWIARC